MTSRFCLTVVPAAGSVFTTLPSSILSSAISSVFVATSNFAFASVSLAEASERSETSGTTTSPRPPEAKNTAVPIPKTARTANRISHHFFCPFFLGSGRTSSSSGNVSFLGSSFGRGIDLNESGIGVSAASGVITFVSLSIA